MSLPFLETCAHAPGSTTASENATARQPNSSRVHVMFIIWCRSNHSRSAVRGRQDSGDHGVESARQLDQREGAHSGRGSDRQSVLSSAQARPHSLPGTRSPSAALSRHSPAKPPKAARAESSQKSPAVDVAPTSSSGRASDAGAARHSSLLADAARIVKEREQQLAALEADLAAKTAPVHRPTSPPGTCTSSASDAQGSPLWQPRCPLQSQAG